MGSLLPYFFVLLSCYGVNAQLCKGKVVMGNRWTVFIGDLVCVAVVVTLGFLSHGESPITPRWPATFVAFALAWTWVALPAGLLEPPRDESWSRYIGRLAWGWSLAVALGALLRGWMLDRGAPLTFVLVMGLMLFAVTGAWRSFLWAQARKVQPSEPRPSR